MANKERNRRSIRLQIQQTCPIGTIELAKPAAAGV
jgi:hypothetical protein